MRAAALLRLRELKRRGGLALLAVAGGAVFLVALGGGGYGLASDLAVTLGYVAALLCGAFPLAIDRERRRSHLLCASPVAPWAWALGSAAGAGAASAAATFVLFAAAGFGAAAAGGIETHVAYPLNAHGTLWLTPGRPIKLPPDARALKTEVRAYLTAEDAVGAPGSVVLRVDGRDVRVLAGEPIVLEATPPSIEITNPDATRVVGIVADRTAALGAPRPFVWNALLVGVAPALAAFALAAFGAAAGANLTAPVAALLAVTFLLFASLKGFLVETLAHEGEIAAAVAAAERDDKADHLPVRPAPAAVRSAMRGLLAILPDLPAFDRSDRAARGEWAGLGRAGRAAAFAGFGLLCAAALGGLGVLLRRTS